MSEAPKKSLIPDTFRDELLSKCDLVDLIDSYVPLQKRGNAYLACCPFHNEKTPSFNVIHKKQFYYCFGCGASGNAISFIMQYLNQSYPEALETLASRVGIPMPTFTTSHLQIKQSADLYTLMNRVSQFYEQTLSQSPEARAYLEKRGIDDKTAAYFKLGYAPSNWHTLEQHFRPHTEALIKTGMLIQKENGRTCDRYRDRLLFPIHDRKGRLIGFGGRVISSKNEPKYLNSPETVLFQKNRELYGLYYILKNTASPDAIIITEGYLDVISLTQHGVSNVVATLGTSTSTSHIQILAKYTKRLIFCFDGDKAGKQAAWRALEQALPNLHLDLNIRFVFLQEGHDPDSFIRQEGKEAFLLLLKNAVPLERYLFDVLTEGIDLSEIAGRNALLNKAKPLLESIPKGMYQQLLLEELSKRTRIENHRLHPLFKGDETLREPPRKTFTMPKKTPLEFALSLMIQYPNACRTVLMPNMGDFGLKDPLNAAFKAVLFRILESSETNPQVLLEHFRDAPFFDMLCQLAGRELVKSHLPPEKELEDILKFLKKQYREQQIQLLLLKSRQHGLTPEEQNLLQQLLKEKHQIDAIISEVETSL